MSTQLLGRLDEQQKAIDRLQQENSRLSHSNGVLENGYLLLHCTVAGKEVQHHHPYQVARRTKKAVAVMTAHRSGVVRSETEEGSEDGWSSSGWHPSVGQ